MEDRLLENQDITLVPGSETLNTNLIRRLGIVFLVRMGWRPLAIPHLLKMPCTIIKYFMELMGYIQVLRNNLLYNEV